MSKLIVVIASSRSCSLKPGATRIDAMKFATARCGICTPLGRPVEPEVKITYAVSSAA